MEEGGKNDKEKVTKYLTNESMRMSECSLYFRIRIWGVGGAACWRHAGF